MHDPQSHLDYCAEFGDFVCACGNRVYCCLPPDHTEWHHGWRHDEAGGFVRFAWPVEPLDAS